MKRVLALYLTLLLAWTGLLPWASADVVRTSSVSSSSSSGSGAITVAGQGVVGTISTTIVTNGTFTGSATGWTLGGGGGAPDWAYTTDTVTHASGGGTTALEPSTPLTITAGTYYTCRYRISNYVSGSVTCSIGGASGAATNFNTASVTEQYEVIKATDTTNLKLTPTNDFDATIDNVVVNQITSAVPSFTIQNSGSTYPLELRINQSGGGSLYAGDDAGANTNSAANFNTFWGSGSGVGITVGDNNAGFGAFALANQTQGNDHVAVGTNALKELRVGFRTIGIGSNTWQNLKGGNDNIGVGTSAGINYTGFRLGNTCVGSTSCSGTGTYDYTIALGYGADPTASNQAVIGGDDSGAGITSLYIGQGVTKASPSAVTLQNTGGSGTDNAGANLIVAASPSTGTGRSGDLILQTAPSAASTSSSPNTAVDRYRVVSKAVALTDAATTIFVVSGLGAHVRAGGSFEFCAQAGDGTNDQVACCRSQWAAVDTTAGAGGETCANVLDATCSAALKGAASSGTLVITADATTGTDLCNFRITPAGSLSETTYNVYYTVIKQLPSGTIVPQ